MSRSEEIKEAFQGMQDFLENHRADFGEAFAAARQFLSYLPSSVHSVAPRQPCWDPAERREERLFTIVPRDKTQPYKMRTVPDAVFDQGSFMEIGRHFGRPVITGLARLGVQYPGRGRKLHTAAAWPGDPQGGRICRAVHRRGKDRRRAAPPSWQPRDAPPTEQAGRGAEGPCRQDGEP